MKQLRISPEERIARARDADERATLRARRELLELDAHLNPVPRARISYRPSFLSAMQELSAVAHTSFDGVDVNAYMQDVRGE